MWDRVSTLAGEVSDPRRTLPRAMLLAVLMVVLMYLLPTLAVLGVTDDTSEVSMGFYGYVAEKVCVGQPASRVTVCDAACGVCECVHQQLVLRV